MLSTILLYMNTGGCYLLLLHDVWSIAALHNSLVLNNYCTTGHELLKNYDQFDFHLVSVSDGEFLVYDSCVFYIYSIIINH